MSQPSGRGSDDPTFHFLRNRAKISQACYFETQIKKSFGTVFEPQFVVQFFFCPVATWKATLLMCTTLNDCKHLSGTVATSSSN